MIVGVRALPQPTGLSTEVRPWLDPSRLTCFYNMDLNECRLPYRLGQYNYFSVLREMNVRATSDGYHRGLVDDNDTLFITLFGCISQM